MKIKICDAAPQSACSWYRSIGPLSKLSKIDPSISVEYIPTISWPVLADADMLFIARPFTQNFIDAMIMAKNFGVPVWIDFDDCMHELPEYNPFFPRLGQDNTLHNLEYAIENAEIVTVSTETLGRYYLKNNNRIIVIPNALDDYNFNLIKIKNQVDFIAWRGTATHRNDLLQVAKSIHSIAEKFPSWAWSFVGNETWYVTDRLKRIANCFAMTEKDILQYHKYLAEFHPAIHIVPLVDNEFNRCKSNISWIEATLAGSVAVAPDFPEFNRTGIARYTNFEYVLEKLISSSAARKDLYSASFDFIEKNLLLSEVNKKRIELLHNFRKDPHSMKRNKGILFNEMALAHSYCTGKGIELGAAAHNPFGLENCENIAPAEDETFFSESQIMMCGKSAKIDRYGTANNIPVLDNSQDYIISSHVVEHVPDLIGAFLEWNRVLTDTGIIFMIFPKRNALQSDAGRELSTIADFEHGHQNPQRTIDTDKHIWVFTLQSMIDLITYCNDAYSLGWEIIETEETDSKVGNGHTVVCRRMK